MALDKSFDPKTVEGRWYAQWESQGLFEAREHRQRILVLGEPAHP